MVALPRPKLAIVGAGQWGRNIIRVTLESSHCLLVAVVSNNPQTQSLVGPDCRVVASMDQLFGLGAIDGLVIATPTPTHAELALMAIERGIPVLVEKPLALTVDDATALAAAADAHGVYAAVDYIYLFNDAYRMLKQRLAAGGPIEHIESIGGNLGPFRLDTSPLWDYGVHDVSMCCDFMSALPRRVSGKGTRRTTHDGRTGVMYELVLTYPSGPNAKLECGNAMREKKRQFKVTTRNTIHLFDDQSFDTLTETNRTTGQSKVIMTKDDIRQPLERRIQDFLGNLGRGHINPSPLWFSVGITRTLAALDDSIRTDKPVLLNDA